MLARLRAFPYLWLILALTALRLAMAAMADLMPDEAYYWLWAQHPSVGYYDHPPMVAWWIMTTGWIGDAPWLVRLPFVLSFLPLCWLVWDAARVLFDDNVAKRAVLWLNACLLLSVGCVLATPDPPSVLMWAGGLWALARLQASNTGWWWLVFGLFAGLGVEAKYTNLFLGLGVAVWMIMDAPARRWLLTPWPYLGAVVALGAMAPNLIWNAQNDGLTLSKQFGRIGASQITGRFLIEFMFSQPLLLNPLIAVFTCLGVLAGFQASDSRLRLLVALPLPLLAYLLLHVFHDRVQGNWTAPIFPGLILLAAVVANGIDAKPLLRARDWAAPIGIGVSVVVLGALALSLPRGGLNEGWDKLARRIDARAQAAGASWIATTDYAAQGELSYHLKLFYRSPVGTVERDRYGWQGPDPTGLALIVVEVDHPSDLARCFSAVKELGTESRLDKPKPKTSFRLFTGVPRGPNCAVAAGKGYREP